VRPLREEVASAAIQGTAATASAIGLAHLVAIGRPQQDFLGLLALCVYGASMVIAFLASALYHGVQHGRIKQILQKVDHCTIFLLIAGTCTPVALLPLRHHDGVILLAAVWTLAVAGIVLRLAHERAYRRIAIPLYLAMGWLCLAWSAPLYHAIGSAPALLMVAGALSYTGGLLFYRLHHLPFTNPAWHLCVVGGASFFFVAISRLLPA
jgi:hemolysin III